VYSENIAYCTIHGSGYYLAATSKQKLTQLWRWRQKRIIHTVLHVYSDLNKREMHPHLGLQEVVTHVRMRASVALILDFCISSQSQNYFQSIL
jgi:hypothetical protein